MNYYLPAIEKQMLAYYKSLNEKERRRYAALEAQKIAYGGKSYIHKLFGCDFKTIVHGEEELKNEHSLKSDRIRRKGAGRKAKIETIANIDDVFMEVLKDHIAGDPMDSHVKWTNLSRCRIAELMQEKGIDVSEKVVKQLLKKHGFKKRKAQKMTSTGNCGQRDEQFINISRVKEEYMDSPIQSPFFHHL